jgi:hypothetical protein
MILGMSLFEGITMGRGGVASLQTDFREWIDFKKLGPRIPDSPAQCNNMVCFGLKRKDFDIEISVPGSNQPHPIPLLKFDVDTDLLGVSYVGRENGAHLELRPSLAPHPVSFRAYPLNPEFQFDINGPIPRVERVHGMLRSVVGTTVVRNSAALRSSWLFGLLRWSLLFKGGYSTLGKFYLSCGSQVAFPHLCGGVYGKLSSPSGHFIRIFLRCHGWGVDCTNSWEVKWGSPVIFKSQFCLDRATKKLKIGTLVSDKRRGCYGKLAHYYSKGKLSACVDWKYRWRLRMCHDFDSSKLAVWVGMDDRQRLDRLLWGVSLKLLSNEENDSSV